MPDDESDLEALESLHALVDDLLEINAGLRARLAEYERTPTERPRLPATMHPVFAVRFTRNGDAA